MVAWESGSDGSGYGIVAQRFDVAAITDVDGDSVYAPLTDGLLIQRFGFGFAGPR